MVRRENPTYVRPETDIMVVAYYACDPDARFAAVRTSEAATCASLTAAAGLAIALMINPDALIAPDQPAATPPGFVRSAAAGTPAKHPVAPARRAAIAAKPLIPPASLPAAFLLCASICR